MEAEDGPDDQDAQGVHPDLELSIADELLHGCWVVVVVRWWCAGVLVLGLVEEGWWLEAGVQGLTKVKPCP